MKIFRGILFAAALVIAAHVNAANYYWVGGTGTWNQFNTHWATTSGGMVFHSQVPTAADDVIFDVNSFTAPNQTVTLDNGTFNCRSMTWTTGVLYNPKITTNTAFNSFLAIRRSLTTSTAMTWDYHGYVHFSGGQPGCTITAPPLNLGRVRFTGTGEWTLLTPLFVQELSHEAGTIRTNNFALTSAYSISSNNSTSKTLKLGTSAVTAVYVDFSSPQTTLDADSCIITSSEVRAATGQVYNRIVMPGAWNFNNLIMSGCTVKHVTSGTGGINFLIAGGGNVIDTLIISRVALMNGSNTFGYLEFKNNATFSGTNTIGTLFLNNPGKFVKLTSGVTTTVTNTILTGTSCVGGAITLESTAAGTSATISKSSGTVTCYNLALQDITATGGATFIANNSSVISNVTGWTVTGSGPRTLYWVGGSGNWTDLAHWSLTSGGAGGNCIPTPADDVIFNSSSFTGTGQQVFVNASASCNNMTWTGVLFQPNLYNTNANELFNVYGNFSLCPGMTWNFQGTVRLAAATSGKTVNTSGINTVTSSFSCDAGGGGWTLLDSLRCKYLVVNRGTFNSNNQKIRVTNTMDMTASSPKTVLLGKSIVDCRRWDAPVGNLTLDADSSIINCEILASGPNYVYNNVIMKLHTAPPGYCAIMASNCVFDTVIFYDQGGIQYDDGVYNYVLFMTDGDVNGHWCHFDKLECRGNFNVQAVMVNYDTLFLNNPGFVCEFIAGQTQYINHQLIANGSCVSGNITIRSDQSGSQATFSKPSGTVTCSYLVLQDINATGGATFIANLSSNGGNVTGWTINSGGARTLYWVGGTGNWSDPNHWSLTSGGGGGQCAPAPTDDVIFNSSSFPASNTVRIDVAVANCRNMTWTSMSATPVVINTFPPALNQPGDLKIYGSLLLNNQVDWNYDGNVIFTGTTRGNTVDFQGDTAEYIFFDGQNAEWILNGPLNTRSLRLNNGTMKTNNQPIYCRDFCEMYGDTLELGASVITTSAWICYIDSGAFDAGTSLISATMFEGFNQAYNTLDMNLTPYPTVFTATSCQFNYANFSGNFVEFYNCQDNFFVSAVFNGEVILRGLETFGRAEFMEDVIMEDTATFDTLYLNNAGHLVELKENTPYTISDAFLVNGLPGNPITIRSITSGVQAIISKAADTVCVDYLNLQDINGTGGALFYAGLNSTDLGNNNGWNFTSCAIPYTDVWPGDVNYDLVVDNLDAVYLGIAYGTSSYTRSSANLSWTAQPCQEWPFVYTNLVNVNNADCDGNGTVDTLDVAAITANYGQTRPPVAPPSSQRVQPETQTAGVPLFFQPSTLYYNPGDTVTIPFALGTSGSPANNIYGLASKIQYDGSHIVPGSVQITLGNSWLTPNGNRIGLVHDNASQSNVAWSDARTNQQNVSGNGTIGTITFVIASNATDSLEFSFIDNFLLDVDQNTFGVDAQGVTIYLSAPPVATFGASSTEICDVESVSFTDMSSGSPTQWLWTFPGGTPATSTAQNPTVVYNTPGVYDVTLSVTGPSGTDSETMTGYVTVNALPTISFTSNPASGTVCDGESITLSGSGGSSYSWSGGVTDGQAFVPASSGSYTVTGTDINGCTNTATANVTVDPVPSINIVSNPASGIVCNGVQATLTASGAQLYSWSGGITNGVPFTPSATTTYTVTGTAPNGCTATAQSTITVQSCATSTVPCGNTITNKSQSLSAVNVPAATQYRFRFYDNSTLALVGQITQASRTLTFGSVTNILYGNTYRWTVAVNTGSGFGAESSINCTITLAIPQTTLPCGYTYNRYSGYSAVPSIVGSAGYRYSFYDNTTNALVAQVTQPSNYIYFNTVSQLQVGFTYKWTVEVQYNNGSSTVFGPASTMNCTVIMAPPSTTVPCNNTYNKQGGYSACPATPGATGYRFTFYLNSVQVAQRAQTSNYIYFNQVTGIYNGNTYTWTVEVQYNNGTALVYGPASTPCNITFSNSARLGDPYSSQPGDGTELTAFSVLLYPNPIVSGQNPTLSITGANDKEAHVSVVDLSGRIITTYQLQVEGDIYTTELSNFPDLAGGTYLIQVQIGDEVQTLRLIKE